MVGLGVFRPERIGPSAVQNASEFGAMWLEGAVRLGYRKELAAQPEGSASAGLFEHLLAQEYGKGSALNMAATLEIDAVFDSADTGEWLLATGIQAPFRNASGVVLMAEWTWRAWLVRFKVRLGFWRRPSSSFSETRTHYRYMDGSFGALTTGSPITAFRQYFFSISTDPVAFLTDGATRTETDSPGPGIGTPRAFAIAACDLNWPKMIIPSGRRAPLAPPFSLIRFM